MQWQLTALTVSMVCCYVSPEIIRLLLDHPDIDVNQVAIRTTIPANSSNHTESSFSPMTLARYKMNTAAQQVLEEYSIRTGTVLMDPEGDRRAALRRSHAEEVPARHARSAAEMSSCWVWASSCFPWYAV